MKTYIWGEVKLRDFRHSCCWRVNNLILHSVALPLVNSRHKWSFYFLEAVAQADQCTVHRAVQKTSFFPWLHNRNFSDNWPTEILIYGLCDSKECSIPAQLGESSVRSGTHYPHVTWAHVLLRVRLGCERRFNIEFYGADSRFCHSAYVTWSHAELWSAQVPARLWADQGSTWDHVT